MLLQGIGHKRGSALIVFDDGTVMVFILNKKCKISIDIHPIKILRLKELNDL
jgi:hypothetical protein